MSSGKISGRTDSSNVIVSICPDVCLTPCGSSMVPVAYSSIGFMDQSNRTSPSVGDNVRKDFQLNSRIVKTTGTEPGTGRGVVIAGHLGPAAVIVASSTVYSERWPMVRHMDKAVINMASLGAQEKKR